MAPPSTVTPLVLVNAAVVDTAGGMLAEGQDILVADGTIVSISATGGAVPDGAEVVDATGLYVTPGLIDMHAHPLNQKDPDDALALMFLYGVTGFRQMSGTDDLVARRAAGELVFPPEAPALLATSGPILTPMNAANPDAAIAEVARQHEAGADFIKAALVTTEVLFAAQAEANRWGIPLVGHLPTDIDVREAARAGMRSIEHLGPGVAMVAASSHDERELRDAAAAPNLRLPSRRPPAFLRPLVERLAERVLARIVLNPLQRISTAGVDNLRHAIDTFDEERARELARELRDHETWQCPTLVRVKGQELCADRAFEADPDLRFLSSSTRDRWFAAAKKFRTGFSIEQRQTFADQYALQLRLVKIFDEEGVPLLAGTDAVGAVWVVPGASLHREFDELTAAGLSALRVLQIATLDAARFLGRDDLGRVAPGYRADLLLLEQNPLDDARNLRSIAGIVRDGRYSSPDDLTSLHTRLIRHGVES